MYVLTAVRLLRVITWVGLLMGLATPTNTSAQCSDPSTHFRGGVWKQWILQITPGPQAQAAVQRVIAEVNLARTAASLPPLIFDSFEPIVVSVIEEKNPRGPDGLNLANRLPNQEVFFATFAEVGDLNGPEIVLFLTDPLRSNSDLTAKGVPGTTAVFEQNMKFSLSGSSSAVTTKWVASNTTDQIQFVAQYSSSDIGFRLRSPGPASYLNCNLGKSADVVYRSLPTQMFGLYDHGQNAILPDLTLSDIDIRLRVQHHDPDIRSMFNDPANRFSTLFEIDRVVRFERE